MEKCISLSILNVKEYIRPELLIYCPESQLTSILLLISPCLDTPGGCIHQTYVSLQAKIERQCTKVPKNRSKLSGIWGTGGLQMG